MNRCQTLLAVVVCFSILAPAGPLRADDKNTETLAQHLDQLRNKLDHAARRANQPTAEGSNVVGLRGSKQESSSKQLYWKGQKGKAPVTTEEIRIFRAAVDEARGGKTAEAVSDLKLFKEKYPESTLLPDVEDTLSRLTTAKP
jgi:TolA-binding protein